MSSEIERGRVTDGPHAGLNELLGRASLVDHHTHSIVPGTLDREAFTLMLTESDRRSAADAAGMDSQVAFAVRRWCAPLLDMPAHASAEEYLEQRLAMSNETAAARLL
ncbi:MAG: amidohydrolase, partial [Candidatus Limnocylindria bacterium]